MNTQNQRKLRCKVCGNTEFTREYHTASSDLACTKCGTVLEENPIVSEVTFAETSNGGAMIQGSFVGSDQAHANFGNNRGSLDSREQTLANGRKRIKNVASALGIQDYISDAAYQWFQLALTNNFVQGRRSQNVVAACLYIACRKEKTHHMLIDFSSRLQVSVFAVGATFLKMVKALHITDLPLIDPSLFIQHFADKLDFGRAKLKVINDALKLARRMDDNWLYEGRRPSGIAGACILLAARMNNFHRTHSEIVAVSHVGTSTIQKRLWEFQKTYSSNLSIEKFRKNEKVRASLPPSFIKDRTIEKKRKKAIRESEKLEDSYLEDPILSALLEDSDVTEEEIKYHIKVVLKRQLKKNCNGVNGKLTNSKDAVKIVPQIDSDDEYINGEGNEDELDGAMKQMIEKNKPKNLAKYLPKTEDLLKTVPDDSDLSDVDDLEIDNILLTDKESKLKEQIWVGNNQDYLLEQEKRRLKEESDKIAGHTAHVKKRRKRSGKDSAQAGTHDYGAYLQGDNSRLGLSDTMGAAITPADNARQLIQKKSLSKKINYAAVNELFNDS
ncbi:hypothetical protein HII12_001633 [Brettanomyces bruxellensis]|uniref:B-related factor 1 n=1 Tax=Dekkera bruxellensis TaxID=5007 RepID=A0A7D9D189_DEKBR|nr:uncharacterized protein BRETT_004633 [Brettanomyces bruxellensis]KAF6013651.1 hypothetical protein HII12_001633 [Brettanomyces bruxellensis]QOU19985.1 hypothetical protein BRETT_004633 [Brettanomyces bruxellensis]VUG20176.1 BRF1 [Brettanomyces bruxellensis]